MEIVHCGKITFCLQRSFCWKYSLIFLMVSTVIQFSLMTKTRQKLHFPPFFRKIAALLFISCIIFQRTQSSRLPFFYSFLISSVQNRLRLERCTWFSVVFCFTYYLFSFSATCLSVIALALSVRPVFPLKPWQRWHLPSQDLDPMGLVSDNLQTPWTCQQNAKLAPIWFVCQFRSAVASALGGRPVFLLVTQDLGPWGVVSANLGIFVPKPSFIYDLFLPIMIWNEKEKHFHCNLVSRRLGVMRQLVPDEYCRGHHSRIIYIKVFLQYITYYTVIRF